MYWDVSPPDKERYIERCHKLREGLEHIDVMPPFLIADQCRHVLKQALGGSWHVVWWMVRGILHNHWSRVKDDAWWTWHLYIRLRTMDEISEIAAQELERITGEDHREWPNVIDEPEFESSQEKS
jgi:hypothetical protein